MNNYKDIYNLLNLTESTLFRIKKPTITGVYRLSKELYIQKQNSNGWEPTIFQLCDLFNGTLEIEPV